MVYGIIISDAALAMLDSHIAFLAYANKKAALRTIDEILSGIESLSTNPKRYPYYDNPFITNTIYRKMPVATRYIVIYEVSDDTVFIDYIFDGRQDYEMHLK